MSKRIDVIISQAVEECSIFLDAIPPRRTIHRVNAERVVAICKELVSSRPAQEPLSPRVAEAGQIRYGSFPAEQSLLNRYRALLRIWRKGFQAVIDISAPVSGTRPGSMGIEDADLASLDMGTRARIQIIMAVVREQKVENDRLKKLIRDTVPASEIEATAKRSAPPALSVKALSSWLAKLDSGSTGLDVDAVGVRISRRVRPGQVIISSEVVMELRAVCDTGPRHSPGLLSSPQDKSVVDGFGFGTPSERKPQIRRRGH